MNVKSIFDLLKRTYKQWSDDKAQRLGAALAYYAIFSIAPLLIIIISVVGLVYGEQAVRGQLQTQIQSAVGPDAAHLIQTMVAGTAKRSSGIIGTLVGIGSILLGAAGVFIQLKDALNTVWGADTRASGISGFVRQYVLAFLLVLGIGVLLLITLVVSSAISALAGFLAGVFPGLEIVAQVVNFLVQLGIITLLFAMIFKLLPNVDVPWSDVWLGAAVTSFLFVIGQLALGLYFGLASPGSSYGAAGSLVVLLVWIYYSAQILFFGAEFTEVYSETYGSRFVRQQAQQGMAPAGQEKAAVGGGRQQQPEPAQAGRTTREPAPAGPPLFAATPGRLVSAAVGFVAAIALMAGLRRV